MSTLSLPGFPPPPKASLSQFDTPRDTAMQIAKWANVRPGMKVLEPSAGLGHLAISLGEFGVAPFCVEIDPDRVAILRSMDFETLESDFLLAELRFDYDLAVMNPPFENDQDSMHIERALCFAKRVVAHVPTGILVGVGNCERLWERHTLSRLALCKRRPKYVGKGGMTDMCTVEVLRGKHDMEQSIEWW